MSLLPLAFLLGFLGSLHCAVMCGPLMLALPIKQGTSFQHVFSLIQYQIGRVATYALLGVIAGVIGSSIKAFSNQESLSFVMGFFLLLIGILYLVGHRFNRFSQGHQKLFAPIGKMMTKVYGLRYWGFLAGLLNGLIPCGMVYLALATALNEGSVGGSMWFMIWFGLGTAPLMLFISIGGIYLKKYIRFNSTKLIPWFTLFLGALFILRSANLGVPFLSPDSHTHAKGNVAECR